MSTPVRQPWLCAHVTLGFRLLLLASLLHSSAGVLGNCSHPVVPEHGGFRCESSPCRGFPHKTTIHFFCGPGFHIPGKVRSARCRTKGWVPSIPPCVPLKDRYNMKHDDKNIHTMPSIATTAVGVSIFLLTTTACMVIRSRLYPCHSHGRRSSDQMDLMVDGLPVTLPSYEEAVYGSWGQRLPSCPGPGPTQLLLAQEVPDPHQSSPNDQLEGGGRPRLSSQSPDNPPPPYEEIQRPRPQEGVSGGQIHQSQATLLDDKDP
ncbi:sushi domain-containing protein 6 isoform X1 [Gadus macrocephalus]|uniref:sushi domain-containing protein 6 isoform X1 n=1 Tax=Gadus macrocephalus TaxID=80720 RepID=UPI0028CB4897|nr:sushi domain-containing protein 6 isoform X1 [Gadus macrocephalus]